MVNLHDVASRAGVSVSVASRVLSNAADTRVSDATRLRIEDAARTLDYRPNFAARALRSARTNIIALIVPDLTNAIFTELMEGVEETALSRSYTVLLARAEDMQPGGVTFQRLVGERRVDGVLLQMRDEPTPAEISAIVDSDVPVVFINSLGTPGIGSVVLPDVAGARIATQHLLELGHRDLAMIGGGANSYTAQERMRGFRDQVEAAGLTIAPHRLVSVGYSADAGAAGIRKLMTGATTPTGIFVANVNAALGALLEARKLGIRVPDDLSIVALHDAWTAEYTWPPLTTVRMPLRKLGSDAVIELLRRLDDPRASPADVLVEEPAPTLVFRESTSGPGIK